MLDSYNRNIAYVRISVTDRCNLRCMYCMPEEGVECMQHGDILSFEEITSFVKEVVKLGITKVRLTGGEPLVRKDIVSLVTMIASIPEVVDLAMTTNGILLPGLAADLKAAGLDRLNISLDTINAAKFADVTRGGNIQDVFNGIKAAQIAGFKQIKINAVRFNQVSKLEEQELVDYCKNEQLELRFIRQMNLKTGLFSQVEGGEAGNCSLCNRIRLTANGYIKPCLFSDQEFSIRELGITEAVELAISNKPQCGTVSNNNKFSAIGG